MIKRYIIIPALLFCLLPLSAQVDKEGIGPKREVTLYNPYKPSLSVVQKRNFLPDLNDTVKIRPDFHYEISTKAFQPVYPISQIKSASLLPDPLPKLYKSYIKLGMGNYVSPLAELSITNERSKKGAIGFYGRHFSNNGNIKLDNDRKVYAGYMDNEASLFGKKFFKSAVLEGSADFLQKTRYAYGYDTSIMVYAPSNKDIKLTYNNIGAKASLASSRLDSSRLAYDFDILYDYFTTSYNLSQHNVRFSGIMSKSYRQFYVGSGIEYDHYKIPALLRPDAKYIASISPFVKNSSDQWSFKVAMQAVVERSVTIKPVMHIYPDLYLGFNIVPAYINFFAALTGKLEKNDPLQVISENPFLYPDGSIFTLPNTDHELIVSAGFKGKTGLRGNYLVSASYSIIKDMLLYTNLIFPDSIPMPGSGNYFSTLSDDAELLNVHAELNQPVNDRLTLTGVYNFYRYTLTANDYAWNKPDWDSKIGIKYNLRDKIIAGLELAAIGKRKLMVNGDDPDIYTDLPVLVSSDPLEMPSHFNLNLSAEYRYSKILSIWAKANNISYDRYYEWAYYPSKRFFFMLGFTYSL